MVFYKSKKEPKVVEAKDIQGISEWWSTLFRDFHPETGETDLSAKTIFRPENRRGP